MSTLREGRNSLFSAFFIVKNTQEEKEKMNVTLLAQGSVLDAIGSVLKKIDDFVWGVPLIVLSLAAGLFLTIRLGFLQIRYLPKALKFMVKNEKGGDGEVSSFGALCTAMSATIGTGNIVGVATALVTGGPGALFWMWIAALFGMATKYSEGLLAVKYRVVDENGHALGGPFYYIERGMGKRWKWLAKIFAFFGMCVGLFGIGTFTQVNGVADAVRNFFDPVWNGIFLDCCDRGADSDFVCCSGRDRRDQADRQCFTNRCAVYGDHLCAVLPDRDGL